MLTFSDHHADVEPRQLRPDALRCWVGETEQALDQLSPWEKVFVTKCVAAHFWVARDDPPVLLTTRNRADRPIAAPTVLPVCL